MTSADTGFATARPLASGAAGLVQSVDWVALAPTALAAVFALAVLVADLFVPDHRKRLLGTVSITGLGLALLSLLPLRGGRRATFCLTGQAADPGTCSYRADHFAVVVQLLVLGGALLTAVLSLHGAGASGERARVREDAGAVDVRRGTRTAVRTLSAHGARPQQAGTDGGGTDGGGTAASAVQAAGMPGTEGLPGSTPFPGEYWFLLLASAAGAALLPAARDLATLVVALETATLPAFALVGIRRGDRRSAEAALKFFLSSVTATAVMLLGISFVYAATGSLYLEAVADGLGHVPGPLGTLAGTGVVLTLVGFAFKTSVTPFHLWVPDTYVGAPLPVAAYLSVVSKAVGLSGLVLVTVVAFRPYAHLWGPVVAVLAALTMTAGNTAALRQSATRPRGAVRLLAWSSVAQAGYLLVPVASAAYAGAQQIGSTLAYALMYAVVNIGAFGVVALVARESPANRVADYRGLFARRPFQALALGFFLLCLAGLPPGVVGLFAKVSVFGSAVHAGLGWLAAVMAANVVCALFYYLRWTASLFGGTPDTAPERAVAPRVPAGVTGAVALAALAAAVLSGAPELILRLTTLRLF